MNEENTNTAIEDETLEDVFTYGYLDDNEVIDEFISANYSE